MEYKDKHGKEIKAGMTLRHNDGEIDYVVACGDNDLGFSADNPNYIGGSLGQVYPLSEFSLREWEIVDR